MRIRLLAQSSGDLTPRSEHGAVASIATACLGVFAALLALFTLAHPAVAAGQSVTLSIEPDGSYFATYRSASGSAQSRRDVNVTSDSRGCLVTPRPDSRGRYGAVRIGDVSVGTIQRCQITATAEVSGQTYRSVPVRVEVHQVTAWALRIVPPVVAVRICPAATTVHPNDTVRFVGTAVLADGSTSTEGITYGAASGLITPDGLWRAPAVTPGDTVQVYVWAEAGGVRSRRNSCP